MNHQTIVSAVTYYLQGLTERTRREKTGTKWGIDWVAYNIGLARFGKPIRLPFLRSESSGFPKSKVEAEFGIDLAFLSSDGRALTIFVLKDEPLTNGTWTREKFDSDLRMAMFPDLAAVELQLVATVTVILAYNKDDQQNGIEAYNRLVSNAPATLRNGVTLGFLRWNLSDLVEQTVGNALSPALLPERFFGQLTYISAQTADFMHGSDAWSLQLVPNWIRFVEDVISETVANSAPAVIRIALIIVRHQASANKSIETGWIDLIEWAALALWRMSTQKNDATTSASVQEFWSEVYIAELERFYRSHIDDLATEHAVDRILTGGAIDAIASSYVMYWHIGRLGILASAHRPADEGQQPGEVVQLVGTWMVMLVNSSPSTFRPVLDIQHVEWFLLIETLRLSGRTHEIPNVLMPLVDRLYLRRIGHSELPFLDGRNSVRNVLEHVATKPERSLLLTESSFFVLMLLEVCLWLPATIGAEIAARIHRRLVLGAFDSGEPGDQKPIYLMSWQPPQNWARQVFEAGPEDGQCIASPPLIDDRDALGTVILDRVRNLVADCQTAGPQFSLPEDIPLAAALLACLRHRKPIPPTLWRRTMPAKT